MKEPRRGALGPRLVAVRTLLAVDRGADLDRALDRELRAGTSLDRRDRALATAIACEATRHRRRIDAALERGAGRKLVRVEAPVRAVLRAAASQLLCLDGVPAYAAVSTAADSIRELGLGRAAGLVNAVLRAVTREAPVTQLELAVELSYPSWLLDRWLSRHGAERGEALARRWNEPAALTLRLSRGNHANRDVTAESAIDALLTRFAAAGHEASRSPWLPDAVRVRNAHPSELPGFAEGLFQAQDEGSQAVGWLLAPEPGEIVLDLCAGLGTKTSQIFDRAGGAVRVVASDRSAAKLRALIAEARRAGRPAGSVLRAVAVDGTQGVPFRDGTFDRVLVDAPCTGLGAIRRHPEIKWRRQPADLARAARTQLALLREAARVVRPGGVIVYATCSTEPEEDEQVISGAMAEHPDLHVESARDWLPAPFASLVGGDGFLRTYPEGEGMDGFFAARLRRSDRG